MGTRDKLSFGIPMISENQTVISQNVIFVL